MKISYVERPDGIVEEVRSVRNVTVDSGCLVFETTSGDRLLYSAQAWNTLTVSEEEE